MQKTRMKRPVKHKDAIITPIITPVESFSSLTIEAEDSVITVIAKEGN